MPAGGYTAQHPAISLKNCAMPLICRWARGRLWSSTSSLLDVRPTVADRSFATAACPRIWNGLPDDVMSATSLLTFRRKLKAHLFRHSYSDIILSIAKVDRAVFYVGQQEGHPACKKTEWWGAGVVICLERGADLHTAQLMPLPLTVSCSSKIQIGFTFLVPAQPGSPGKRAVKRVCV